ncbi:MAG TPA: class I SAM-dependent methyltransferase [Terracidiphilus sp.]|nr:class I SAM-dependent methyltransferase [Terracidiphilus sp.]
MIPRRGTFRDPQGRLFQEQDSGRILREIRPPHEQAVTAWLQSSLAQDWMNQRLMVPTQILPTEAGKHLHLEHERIFFPSYPWEWTPGQWRAAASLTLDLLEEALKQDLILKDATPLNVLYSGSKPIFVDVLSFGAREIESPLWLAHAQFIRMFLLPLVANTHLGWPLAATLQRRDGYEPADLAPWLGPLQRWRGPFRSLVTIPHMLERRFVKKNTNVQAFKRTTSKEVSASILRSTVRSLRKQLASLAPSTKASRWSDYTQTATHYASSDQTTKQDFVREMLERIRPVNVLDVGANTGVYSRIAASCGSNVVAWDSDIVATELNWQQAYRENARILPLVADFARPTPAAGWLNRECASLLARARKRFDCVLMLGVLHHLLVADQIPLEEILGMLGEITTLYALVEWVPKTDSQFVGLSRGREALYEHLDEEFFKKEISRRFVVRGQNSLQNGRTLWLLEKN